MKMNKVKLGDNQQDIAFFAQIRDIILAARQKAYSEILHTLCAQLSFVIMRSLLAESWQITTKLLRYGKIIYDR